MWSTGELTSNYVEGSYNLFLMILGTVKDDLLFPLPDFSIKMTKKLRNYTGIEVSNTENKLREEQDTKRAKREGGLKTQKL